MNKTENQPNAFAGIQPEVLATAAALPTKPTSRHVPRVEPVRIDALVASLTYETAHVPNTNTTVATARLPGGFVVAMGASHTVSAALFDAELGRKYAIEDAERQARQKLWEMEGYALYLRLEQLRAAGVLDMPAHEQRVVLEKIELDDRIAKLGEFINESPRFETLFEHEQERLRDQLTAMRNYSDILSARIAAFPVGAA